MATIGMLKNQLGISFRKTKILRSLLVGSVAILILVTLLVIMVALTHVVALQ